MENWLWLRAEFEEPKRRFTPVTAARPQVGSQGRRRGGRGAVRTTAGTCRCSPPRHPPLVALTAASLSGSRIPLQPLRKPVPPVKILPNITGLRTDEQLSDFLAKHKAETVG